MGRRPARDSATPGRLVGQVVREARRGRFTLATLSERSGVSIALLSLIERGQGNPSINTLAAISGALDMPLPALIEAALAPGDGVAGDDAMARQEDGSGEGGQSERMGPAG